MIVTAGIEIFCRASSAFVLPALTLVATSHTVEALTLVGKTSVSQTA